MIPCSHWWPEDAVLQEWKADKRKSGSPWLSIPCCSNKSIKLIPCGVFVRHPPSFIPVLWLTWNRSAVWGPGTQAWRPWWGSSTTTKSLKPKREEHTNEAESWGTEVRWQMISEEDSGKTGTIWAAENNDYYHKTKFSYIPSPLWRAWLHGIGLVKLLKFPLI